MVAPPATITIAMADKINHGGFRMWWWSSLEAAERWGDWANIALVSALAIGVVATFLIVSTTNVKEGHWRESRRQSDEKIAELTNQTEQLRKARLELERAVSPRILEQGLTAQSLRRFSDTLFLVLSPADFEPRRTAGQIRFMLRHANWKPFTDPVQALGSPFRDGVEVGLWRTMFDERARAAANALVSILNENGIEAKTTGSLTGLVDKNDPGLPGKPSAPAVIVVRVGPKPLPASLQLDPGKIPADPKGNRMFGNIVE
jgi:hypothetical protein